MKRHVRAFRKLASDNGTIAATKLAALRIAGSSQPRQIRKNSIEFLVRPSGPDIEVVYSCLSGEFDCLRHAYPENVTGLIIDAGGHIGAAAVSLARLYPNATIITVEPSSENFELLTQNISPYPNIQAIHAAIMPKGGEHINMYDPGFGSWGFSTLKTRGHVIENVPTVGIRDLLDQFGNGRALIAKIDIEGAETGLFREPNWLDEVGVLMVELHERFSPGCENVFWEANRERFVFKAGGEKFVSVGPTALKGC